MGVSAKKFFLVLGAFLFAGLAAAWGIRLYQRYRSPSLVALPPVTSFDTRVITGYNSSVFGKPGLLPYAVARGTITVQETGPRFLLTLQGVTQGKTTNYPLDDSGVFYGGLYREVSGGVQYVPAADWLRPGDTVHILRYANRDQGLVWGIVRTVERSVAGVVVRFLYDPRDTPYLIPSGTLLQISDPSQLFALDGRKAEDIAEGNILRLEYLPIAQAAPGPVRVATATLAAPAYRLFTGTLTDIEQQADASMTFKLAGRAQVFTADRTTVIYVSREPPALGTAGRHTSLPLTQLRAGRRVALFAYVAADHWQILTAGLDTPVKGGGP